MKEVRSRDKSCKSHWDIHDSETKEVNKCWKTEITLRREDQGQSPKEQLAREVKKKEKEKSQS